MPHALFLSSHAGDVAFSCGATLCRLLRGGWTIQLVTVFDASDAASDAEFCRVVGLENCTSWQLAPDDVAALAARLEILETPDIVFAPQGLDATDASQTLIRAVLARGWAGQCFWYRELPRALHESSATPSPLLPQEITGGFVAFGETEMELKIAGCSAYTQRVAADFAHADEARQLRAFHASEAEAVGQGEWAERFLN